jgi:predicted MFS family arabinose efflux permease
MKRALELPAYRRLLTAFGLNELAWSVGTLALAVLVYRRTGSALGSTAFFLCSQVIPAFISPAVVAHVDQRAPRRILPVLYGLEGVLFGLLAWMTARFSLLPVLTLALADGIVAIVARALARTATVKVLRPANLLHEGNAVTNGVFSGCFMAGPLLGGLVVVAGGTVAALLINCALFAAMALILATARGLPGAVPDAEPTAGRLRSALGHVRGDRALRWLFLLQALGMVVFTISIPVEVVFAQHSLHAGAGGYGALLSGWGAGAVIGSAAYARWRRRSARTLMALSGVALAVGFWLMAAAPSIGVAVVGAAIGGGGNGVESVAARTVLQEYTPQRWLGLVMGLNEAVSEAAPGIGIVIGGVIAELADPRVAFSVAGAGSLAFVVLVWIVLRPSAMPPPPPDPEARQPAVRPAIVPAAVGSRGTLV